MRFLFVCDDNRRASPMAAAFLYHQQRLRRLDGLVVASAGFGPAGLEIEPSVVSLLEDRGVDLSRKRTRELDADIVGRADVVATMTGTQAVRAMNAYPEVAARVFTLRHLCSVVNSRPRSVSPAQWSYELAARVERSYSSAVDPSLDIAEPTGAEFGAILNLADQLLVAVDHLTRCIWPDSSVVGA